MPRHFGNSTRPLFGVLHHPERRSPLDGALLCGSVGVEAIRTHWLIRQLADRLCRAGRGALRFDYTGTGDSFGDHDDASFERWVEDSVTAGGELMDEVDSPRLSGFGVRLGALLLWHAAGQLPIRRLVLLDPVLSGAAWVRELERLTAARLDRWKHLRETLTTADRLEVGGFVWPRRLLEEIRGRAIDTVPARTLESVTILLTDGRVEPNLDGFVDRLTARNVQVAVRRLQAAAGWDEPALMERQLLAGELNEAIFDALTGRGER